MTSGTPVNAPTCQVCGWGIRIDTGQIEVFPVKCPERAMGPLKGAPQCRMSTLGSAHISCNCFFFAIFMLILFFLFFKGLSLCRIEGSIDSGMGESIPGIHNSLRIQQDENNWISWNPFNVFEQEGFQIRWVNINHLGPLGAKQRVFINPEFELSLAPWQLWGPG